MIKEHLHQDLGVKLGKEEEEIRVQICPKSNSVELV